MSAPAKPPRKKPGPAPPSPEQIARVLVDAETLGDAYSAKRHKVSERTVKGWRAQYGSDPNVAQLCTRFRERINDGWIIAGRAARLRLIERQMELAEQKGATLDAVTNALRRTHEVVLSHEIVSEGGDPGPAGSPGAEHRDHHQPTHPREAEGEGGATGDEGAGGLGGGEG